MSLTVALVISSVLFVPGRQGSAVTGFALGLIAPLSGCLLLPIVLHCVMDLQTGVYFRPDAVRGKEAGDAGV